MRKCITEAILGGLDDVLSHITHGRGFVSRGESIGK